MSIAPVCIALLASAATAFGQTGAYTWQVSTDSGATWSSHAAPAPLSTVKVRLLAAWSGIVGSPMGYAGGQFDAFLQGATASDSIVGIRTFSPFVVPPGYAAHRFASGIKIDTPADTELPGLGTGWVNPGQAAADFAAPGTYVTDNPAAVFFFDFLWSGAQPVTIGMVLNQTTARAMAIYTTSAGQQHRLSADQVTISVATISVPEPASILSAAFALITCRRRRNSAAR